MHVPLPHLPPTVASYIDPPSLTDATYMGVYNNLHIYMYHCPSSILGNPYLPPHLLNFPEIVVLYLILQRGLARRLAHSRNPALLMILTYGDGWVARFVYTIFITAGPTGLNFDSLFPEPETRAYILASTIIV